MSPGDLVRVKCLENDQIDILSSTHRIKRREFHDIFKTHIWTVRARYPRFPGDNSPGKKPENGYLAVECQYQQIWLVTKVPVKWVETVFVV